MKSHIIWKGILVEPSRKFYKDLKQNRNCILDDRCVYSQSGLAILFNEAEWGELSTIDKYSNQDGHSIYRKQGLKYDVKTISLKDLLDQHNAPVIIDYLSIDTEGSEYDILEAFSFKDYSFRIITVEHNYIELKRNKIKELLESNGYGRVLEHLSKWDDYYINLDLKK